ncbi:hypothetical protein PHLGIDRAFT_168146 [Phlebiopsis gigantea 11061_1 CR5-6]|uniref:FAD-binding domain-containing protein n=1 Tax=Phlebiopsis gigantea (strain 11061_1 CR5-6) TaxID=745531 RepID=A0A0C3S4N0_PHLG1|nr:hypothetical protein PHLGIDRAFT_168146 [Phlebiopsis gigantea 11061_1 CR5-6]
MSSSQPRFTVGICGGGVSGLCIAVALSRCPDIEVHVYEAANSFKEIGAGVMIWGRAWRALSLLGLDQVFREVAGAPADGSADPQFGFDYRRSDLGSEGFLIHRHVLPYPGHNFHRAHFLDALADLLPAGVAHLGKRLVSFTYKNTPTGQVGLHFVDGTSATCDVLLGCDGIRSVVRRCMFEGLARDGRPQLTQYIEPMWTGEILYRCLIPSEELPLKNGGKHPVLQRPIIYCGNNKHFFGYSIGRQKWVNVGGFVTTPGRRGDTWEEPWVSECSVQEVVESFAGWERDLQDIIKCVERPMKWAVHQVKPLPFFAHRHVALVGDAAHAMTTHQASGAEQAIEDACVLAALLSHSSVTQANLSQALKAYERVRLPIAQHVMAVSAATGELYEMRNGLNGDGYSAWISELKTLWRWVAGEDLKTEINKALVMTRDIGGTRFQYKL